MMIGLTDDVIDARALEAAVARPEAGAILTFHGVTRNNFEGRPVRGLVYEAYAAMAVPEMERIAAEAMARWPEVRVAMVHRTGTLDVGEASVVIAVSAPHRDAAYEAGRFAIDALKERVPVWKKELYDDGAAWKANAESPVQPGGTADEEPPGEVVGDPPVDHDRERPEEIGRTFDGLRADGEGPRFRTRSLDRYPRPDLNPYLKAHQEWKPEVITSAEGPAFRGRWADAFGRPAPLHVEIGPGNGFFLAGMAARHPEYNWLGIELRFKRVVLTARKLRRAGVRHGRVLRYDARFLGDLFAEAEIDALYVNHPDPWTRKRHAKHRLLGRPFAEWIVHALKPGGRVRIKTDYHPNLDRFQELIVGLPLEVRVRVDDVFTDGSPWGEDDVETNYQRKFRERGEPVAALELVRR
ncbi:MAG: hypothetical protein D6798_17835 [Deltaproteobacteria bacterium]|nr:MAG: hypothetical protein D6798_17835 [Deltaproteobacteria bacterium]